MRQVVDWVYEKFATYIAVALLAGTMAVILLATVAFLRETAMVVLSMDTDVSYVTLQRLFDLLLGAIIAVELAHSVHLMVTGGGAYAQVRIVLVIGILAVVRKLIVIELAEVSGILLLGLAAAVAALGGAFALVQWIERRSERDVGE